MSIERFQAPRVGNCGYPGVTYDKERNMHKGQGAGRVTLVRKRDARDCYITLCAVLGTQPDPAFMVETIICKHEVQSRYTDLSRKDSPYSYIEIQSRRPQQPVGVPHQAVDYDAYDTPYQVVHRFVDEDGRRKRWITL